MRVRLFRTLPAEARISSEVYARELLAALRALGEPDLSLSDVRPTSSSRATTGGLAGRLAGYVDRYVHYQWQAREQDADVNHVVDHGYGHLAFSLRPERTVVTFHDAMLLKLEARELPTRAYPRFTILGHRLSLTAIRRGARVIADSRRSADDFLRFLDFDPARVRVVPLGVSPSFAPPASNSRDPVESRAPVILHVGHCGPYKNLETILDSIPRIGRRLGRPVVFTKVGGELTPQQRRLISRLGIERQVRHLGHVPAADLPAAYASADVLLMPSLYEGFGLPALEAMACGTPVVVSNQGALPELVGGAALQVEPLDVEAVAEAVARVVSEPALRAELRRRGLERARQFTWERTARETLAVYREVYDASH